VRLVKNFLQDQLELIKEKLNSSEIELKNYKEQASMVGLPQEVQDKVTRLTEFESYYHSAKLELESNLKRLEYIDTQLDKSKQNINMENILTSPVLDELKQQMAEIQANQAKLVAGMVNQGVYDKNNPQLNKYNERLNLLKQNFQSSLLKLASTEMVDPIGISESLFARKMEIETEVQALRPKVVALKKTVDEFNAQLNELPEKSLKLARLERSTKVDENLYLMMKEKFEESRITEVGQLGNIQIIDLAKPPLAPISPKKRQNLMLGIILGLGLGIGITFFREYMDNSVASIDQVQQLGFSILGAIPEIKMDEAIKKIREKNGNLAEFKNSNEQEIANIVSRMISHFAPKSPIAEAYRSLRTNIQYSKSDKTMQVLLVTSPGPRDGKSTTAVNLAITIAQTGVKTLLVDGDLRRPVLHSIFGFRKNVGLSNCIIGKAELQDSIFPTEIENLHLMPCGTLPPNPSELLGSNSMKKLLVEMRQKFDFIIIDTPPVIAVTDAAVLCSMIDGVILVLKARQTNQEAAQRANELLKNVNAPVLGVILNSIQIESMYGSYYYYYHYYYYYGNDGEKKKKKKVA
jgi:tyrosine-protein kinase Etk/Wzc